MGELWDVYDQVRNKTGRFHERGTPMTKGDYHLIVQVWILNNNGQYLITKRSPSQSFWPNRWHTTGGCAVAGDDSLTTALKEAREELGVSLAPQNGQLFTSFSRAHDKDDGHAFYDIWLFRQEIELADIVIQEEEICDAKWASAQDIRDIIKHEAFIPAGECPYVEKLFAYCEM